MSDLNQNPCFDCSTIDDEHHSSEDGNPIDTCMEIQDKILTTVGTMATTRELDEDSNILGYIIKEMLDSNIEACCGINELN